MPNASRPSAASSLPYWELVVMIACLMALNAAVDRHLHPLAAGDRHAARRRDGKPAPARHHRLHHRLRRRADRLRHAVGSLRPATGALRRHGASTSSPRFAAIFSPTFQVLLALRAVQGVGAAVDARHRGLDRARLLRRSAHGERHVAGHDGVHGRSGGGAEHRPDHHELRHLAGDLPRSSASSAPASLVWAYLRLPETLHPEDRRPLTVEAHRRGLPHRPHQPARLRLHDRDGADLRRPVRLHQPGRADLHRHLRSRTGLHALFLGHRHLHGGRLLHQFPARGALRHAAPVARRALRLRHPRRHPARARPSRSAASCPAALLRADARSPSACSASSARTSTRWRSIRSAMSPAPPPRSSASCRRSAAAFSAPVIGSFYDGTLLPLYLGFVVLSCSLARSASSSPRRASSSPACHEPHRPHRRSGGTDAGGMSSSACRGQPGKQRPRAAPSSCPRIGRAEEAAFEVGRRR